MKKRYSAYRRPIQRGEYVSSGSKLSKSDIMRRVRIDPKTKCWNWPTVSKRDGYGVHGGSAVYRRSQELWNGPIPKGSEVLHKCHYNRACVNPAHLQVGTRSYNQRMKYLHQKKQMPWQDLRVVAELHSYIGKKLQGDASV